MPKSKNRKKGRNRPHATSSHVAPNERRGGSTADAASTRWTVSTLRRIGWATIGLGVFIFMQHLVSHMGFFVVLGSATDDLLIGYPTGAALVFIGVLVLSRADR